MPNVLAAIVALLPELAFTILWHPCLTLILELGQKETNLDAEPQITEEAICKVVIMSTAAAGVEVLYWTLVSDEGKGATLLSLFIERALIISLDGTCVCAEQSALLFTVIDGSVLP